MMKIVNKGPCSYRGYVRIKSDTFWDKEMIGLRVICD